MCLLLVWPLFRVLRCFRRLKVCLYGLRCRGLYGVYLRSNDICLYWWWIAWSINSVCYYFVIHAPGRVLFYSDTVSAYKCSLVARRMTSYVTAEPSDLQSNVIRFSQLKYFWHSRLASAKSRIIPIMRDSSPQTADKSRQNRAKCP